jgi:hypothetical protein
LTVVSIENDGVYTSTRRAAIGVSVAFIAAGLLTACSSSPSPHRNVVPSPTSTCAPATSDQIARVNQWATKPGAVTSGFAVPIPDTAGFSALVAAKISESENRVGVWMLGSDGGTVVGVNAAAEAHNKNGVPHPGSIAAAVAREAAADPRYAALLTCASR